MSKLFELQSVHRKDGKVLAALPNGVVVYTAIPRIAQIDYRSIGRVSDRRVLRSCR